MTSTPTGSPASRIWIADSVVTPDLRLEEAYIRTEGGTVREVGRLPDLAEIPADAVRLPGCTIVPGFIDTHIHGGGGADTMDATPEALETIGRYLAERGVTSWLPTTVTNSLESTRAALDNVRAAMGRRKPGQPEVLGAHLEGPYINAKMKGAQPEEYVRAIDVEECLGLCADVVKVVTLAPEMPNGLDLIEALSQRGINASAGHTDATYDIMMAASERGLSAVTHGFNAQRGLHHREPGVVGAALANRDLRVELIADLIHIHPGAILALWNAKGDGKIVLISDSMRAAGMPDGEWELGGQCVIVRDHKAVLKSGNLAGSITNLSEEIRNLVKTVGIPLESAIRVATTNPARSLCVEGRKGRIAPGADADFVALDADLNVVQTVIAGEVAYSRAE